MKAEWTIKGIIGLVMLAFLGADLAVAAKVDHRKKGQQARVQKVKKHAKAHGKVGMGEQVRLEKAKNRTSKKVAQKKQKVKERQPAKAPEARAPAPVASEEPMVPAPAEELSTELSLDPIPVE